MDITELGFLIEQSWSKDTCRAKYKDVWNESNPSLGQSVVTSLAVNDFFGGEICSCYSTKGAHYYNLIDGKIVDFTHGQFQGEGILYGMGEEVSRQEILKEDDNEERYILLLNNIKQEIFSLDKEVDKVLGRKKMNKMVVTDERILKIY